ncbi:MAG: hypothetical protein ACLFOY_17125 [Desulfatibacillaceae bacterium]
MCPPDTDPSEGMAGGAPPLPEFVLPRAVLAGLPPVHEHLYVLGTHTPADRERHLTNLESLGRVVAHEPLPDSGDDSIAVLFSTILDPATVSFAVGVKTDHILYVNKSDLLCQEGNALHTGRASTPLKTLPGRHEGAAARTA